MDNEIIWILFLLVGVSIVPAVVFITCTVQDGDESTARSVPYCH